MSDRTGPIAYDPKCDCPYCIGQRGSEAIPASDPPRELLCMVCDRDYPVWFAPNDLWNPIMRRPDGSDEYPFLCPTCFGNIAVERGVTTPLMLVAGEVASVSVPLAQLMAKRMNDMESRLTATQRALDEALRENTELRDRLSRGCVHDAIAFGKEL